MTAACLPLPLAAMATAPTEGAPARIEADPQAAEQFSALISMLIPEAKPETTPGKSEKKESGTGEQPLVLPNPVQTFAPPVEVQPAASGGTFTLEVEVEPPSTNTTDAGPATSNEWAPATRPVGVEHARPAPPLPASPIPAEVPASREAFPAPEETEEPAQPAPSGRGSADAVAPLPHGTVETAFAPLPAESEEECERTEPEPTRQAPAPAAPIAVTMPAPQPSPSPVQHASAPRTPGSAEAPRHSEKVQTESVPAEAEPEITVAPARTKEAAPAGEMAFAARLTERVAAAPADAAARPAVDRPAPANRPAPEPPVAPPPVEPPTEAPVVSFSRPVPDRDTPKSPDEPDKTAAAPRPPAGTHSEPSLAPPTPVQPDRAMAKPAPPERPVAPNPTFRPDFEPVRVEAPPQPVRELSVQVPRQMSNERSLDPVEVKVLERAGQVHVAVRSTDPQLNRSLGEGLHELVTNLENRGYTTETWRPQNSGTIQGTLSAAADGPVQQAHQPGAGSESFQESGRGHHGGAGDQLSRQQRRGQDEARPQWLEMLEGAVRQRNSNLIRSNLA